MTVVAKNRGVYQNIVIAGYRELQIAVEIPESTGPASLYNHRKKELRVEIVALRTEVDKNWNCFQVILKLHSLRYYKK